jgi:hypothetical protein
VRREHRAASEYVTSAIGTDASGTTGTTDVASVRPNNGTATTKAPSGDHRRSASGTASNAAPSSPAKAAARPSGPASLWPPTSGADQTTATASAILGQGFYLFAVTVIGVGIGAAIRHTAGAVATVTGLLFLTVMVFKAFTGAEPSNLTHWALSSAAEGLTWTTVQAPEWPSAGEGLLVCLTYLAATTALAALSLRKRDI